MNRALKPGPGQGGRQTPLVAGQQKPGGVAGEGSGDWSKVLDANRAGAAMDAEAFTQEFMSQLTGANTNNLPPQLLPDTKKMNGVQHYQAVN